MKCWAGLLLVVLSGCLGGGQVSLDAQTADTEVVAVVGGRPVQVGEVKRSLRTLKLGQQAEAGGQLESYARAVVYEEALLRFALRNGLAEEPALRRRLSPLVFAYLHGTYVRGKSTVSTEEARAFFARNRRLVLGEQIRARQIVLKDPAECEALRQRIRSEGEFVALVRERSLDAATRRDGGDLGLLQPADGALGFEKALFDLPLGGMQVFTTPQGCHLVRVVERIRPARARFAEVEPAVKAHLRRRKEAQLLRGLVDRALREANVEWNISPPPEGELPSLPAAAP